MPFYVTDCEDVTVKLVKAGVVVGSNLADTVTKWPASDVEVQYGGVSNLWSTTWTPAEVNASDFGVVLSAVSAGGVAQVDRIALRVHYSLPTNADNPSYLSVLEVDDDRVTVTPRIYALPRVGFTVAQDPNLSLATNGGVLRTSRIYGPDRTISKTWSVVEFYAEIGPSNCAGLQVWASVDDGTPFQLLDGAEGTVETFTSDGAHRAFFPANTTGKWAYIEYRPATPSVAQANTAIALYESRVVMLLAPRKRRRIQTAIQVGDGEFADLGSMRRSVGAQKDALEALYGRVVAYRGMAGEEGFGKVDGVAFSEVQASLTKKWSTVCTLTLVETLYT